MSKPCPPALAHGALTEVLPGVHFVTGAIKGPGPIPMYFSRNMAVVVEGERVVLVNSVRLNDAGLAELDALGRVTDVIRLAGFHGRDDRFYKERYGAKVWTMKDQPYRAGFRTSGPSYFEADGVIAPDGALPLADARLYSFETSPSEGLLLLERHGGVLIAGDALQNWSAPDEFFNFFGRFIMQRMGFIRPFNVGPAWAQTTKPAPERLRGILDLPFTKVLPAHGAPALDDAKERFRPSIEWAADRLAAQAAGKA
jgi:hypothetical protein